MRSHTHSARDRTRNGSHTSAEFGSSLGNQQRARARARFDDDRRGGQRSHQSGAGDDPVSGWNGTGRNLANEKANIGYAIKQVAMADRVRAINSVGEDGDRVATRGECGLVRRAFDPVGASRDDNPFFRGNGTGKFPGYMLTVGGAGPSACDRDEIAYRAREEG